MSLLLIPVYAEPLQKHTEYRSAQTRLRQRQVIDNYARFGAQPTAELLSLVGEEVETEEGLWRTDRVLGYFDIAVNDGRIEVGVYKHDSRCFSRRPPLRYRLHGGCVASLGMGDPVAVIVGRWLIGVLKAQQELEFKKRIVDWSGVEALLNFTDLRSTMKCTLRNTR